MGADRIELGIERALQEARHAPADRQRFFCLRAPFHGFCGKGVEVFADAQPRSRVFGFVPYGILAEQFRRLRGAVEGLLHVFLEIPQQPLLVRGRHAVVADLLIGGERLIEIPVGVGQQRYAVEGLGVQGLLHIPGYGEDRVGCESSYQYCAQNRNQHEDEQL